MNPNRFLFALAVILLAAALAGCGTAQPALPTPTGTPAAGSPSPIPTSTRVPTAAHDPTVTPEGSLGPCAGDWVPVWSDEFDGPGVELTKWNVLEGPDFLNNDLHYNTAEDVYIEDGHLVIRQQRRDYGGLWYTSGKVHTRNKMHLLYGRVEIRATSPEGVGFHSALWLTPADGSWPPEIDISEVLGNTPFTAYTAYHYGVYPDDDGVMNSTYQEPGVFHVYAVEWEPDEIRWYLDGEQVFSTRDHVDEASVPMILIMDTVVGGDWPGSPDFKTVFPNYRRIDYARIYRRAGCVTPSPTPDPDAPPTPLPTATPTRTPTPTPDPNTPTPTATPHGELLALAGVNASSVEIESDAADKVQAPFAIDGDRTTRWSSRYSDPQWIAVDLGAVSKITRVVLRWEAAYAKDYALEVSSDGEHWTTVRAVSDGDGQVDDLTGLEAEGRYVRMYGTRRATPYGYSLWEIEVYGE